MSAPGFLDLVALGLALSGAIVAWGMARSERPGRVRNVLILGVAGWLILGTVALAVVGALVT